MKPTSAHEKIEFIHNPDFVAWVLRPSIESDQYWQTYITEHPSQKGDIEQARFLIKGLVRHRKSLSETDVSLVWEKIKKTGIAKPSKLIYLKRWTAAASIIFIFAAAGWVLLQRSAHSIKKIDYKSIAVEVVPGNDIKLILSDQTEKTFASKNLELKYSQEGKLETESGKQIHTGLPENDTRTEPMNQLVVPCGKRSSIVLADGTKLWLNSGSRAIYPVAFTGKTREIYIEGEGYLEVAHDATKPFYVVTDHLKVKVLGTKFDVSAYKDDDHASVVLVEGSVQASIGEENLTIKPNQILNYEKLAQKLTCEKTNVLEYVSWVDGMMLCNKEQIQSVITKLARYYDIKINYNNLNLNNITLTGKLDLKSDYKDVFRAICATAPLNYEMINNTIYLTMKEP